MATTKTMKLAFVVAVVAAMPTLAHAQSTDAAYCSALVQKYEQYLDKDTRQGIQPQSVEARAAVAKCKAGDASGIPTIERALKDAKIDLPPRG